MALSVETPEGDVAPRPGDEADRRGGLPGAEAARAAGVVRVRGVRFGYRIGALALDGLDIEIGVGEIVALVGPKGAGKSTLLRVLAGDITPTVGTVDSAPRRAGGRRVMLGYAGTAGPHFETLSGWDNAVFFARAGGMRRREAEGAVAELMDALGLRDQRNRPVAEYAPEARRKLLLIEALAHRPALTLIDDPFVGLSQRAREALIHVLRLRSAQRGTVVVASEDLALIPELADRIVFMHHGRVVASGRVAELLQSVGSATRLEVTLDRRPPQLDVRFRPGISVVSDGDPYVVETSRGHAAMGEVLAALAAAGATVKSVTVHEADLAEAFRRATGTELQP
jgi:ABC-type multidrug transport system ATPase subunit